MIVLFIGPSLPPSELPSLPDLRVLPPVGQGDVYRAARERPWGIGIVDGAFEHVPAVWHKEILWAMSEGVRVFGASSMGALRAAELLDFGMVGVGRVFEQFRDGVLTGDDEVALTHLSAEHDYRPATEALVDIRATLEAAVAARVCEPAFAQRLVVLAKDRFYRERTWPVVLADARAQHEDPSAVATLERWLPDGRVDQKRRDALALIDAMQTARTEHPGRLHVEYSFEHTDLWEHALPEMREESDTGTDPGLLLEELRLVGDEHLYSAAVQGALLRALADDTVARYGLTVSMDLVRCTATQFRRAHGLYSAPATKAWLAEQGLDASSFCEMMKREAQLRCVEAASQPEARRHVVDQLRAMSCYGELQSRARSKHAALARLGPQLGDPGGDELLLRWYFEERLHIPIPHDVGEYAERFGFATTKAMLRAVRLERWYAGLLETPSGIDDTHVFHPESKLAGALASLDDPPDAANV